MSRGLASNWLLLLACCFALFVGCRESDPVVESGARPDQIIEGFTMHESASGERLYKLEADTAYVFERDGYVDVARLVVTFYSENGEVHARLVADEGTLQSRTNDLVARGNIVVRTADSTLLRTDSLGWNNDVRLVRTDAPVEILTPRGDVRGQGLVADAGLTRIQIQSEVTGKADYRFETGGPGGEPAGEGAGQ
ncbi:MAG: LPS export ABC transporter periplasmic protein LptC [bacterium]